MAGAERLEDRVVLGVDRQHGGAGRRRAAHEHRAGADETLLVGKRDRRAAFDRGECRAQTDRAGDRSHHPVGRSLRRFLERVFAGGGFDAGARQRALEIVVGGRIGNHGKARADLAGDLGEQRRIAPRGERLDAVTDRFALEQVDRAGADRAGGAEDGDAARALRRLRL